MLRLFVFVNAIFKHFAEWVNLGVMLSVCLH
jgi:hypothetical protein